MAIFRCLPLLAQLLFFVSELLIVPVRQTDRGLQLGFGQWESSFPKSSRVFCLILSNQTSRSCWRRQIAVISLLLLFLLSLDFHEHKAKSERNKRNNRSVFSCAYRSVEKEWRTMSKSSCNLDVSGFLIRNGK